MTTVAALQGPDWAVVGYDSRVTDDERIYSLPKDSGKVNCVGEYILGVSGDMRAVNLICYTMKPPPLPFFGRDSLDRFFSSKFIPAMRKCFVSAGYDNSEGCSARALVAVRGVVFEVGPDYDWCREESGVYAIGSGASFALGALYQSGGKNKDTPSSSSKRLREAVGIAAQLDPNTAPPIHIVRQLYHR